MSHYEWEEAAGIPRPRSVSTADDFDLTEIIPELGMLGAANRTERFGLGDFPILRNKESDMVLSATVQFAALTADPNSSYGGYSRAHLNDALTGDRVELEDLIAALVGKKGQYLVDLEIKLRVHKAAVEESEMEGNGHSAMPELAADVF